MTVQPHRSSPTRDPSKWRLVSRRIFIVLVGGALLSACGSDDPSEVSGEIAHVAVTPEAGYPDVEITVDVELDPAGADEEDLSWSVDFGDGNSRSGDSLNGQATHSYGDVGDYQIVVEALHDGDTADSWEETYTVYDPVDVTVDSVSAQPVNILVGEDVTVSFEVQNQTASPVFTPVRTRAYLSGSGDVTREDFDGGELDDLVAVGEQTLELDDSDVALGAGDGRNVSINAPIPDVPSGDYHVIVVLDPDHELQTQTPEATIASSIGSLRIENLDESLPNINVEQLEFLPDRAFPELSSFTRAFEVSNLGGADIFNVVHNTYLQPGSDELDDSAILIDTSDPINLSVHQQETIGPDEFILSEPITAPDDEELELYVIVEAFSEDGDVEEATTDNNIIASDEPIIVSNDPVEGPDIVVEDFSVSPDSTFLDGTLDLEATIANQGTADVPSFFCGVYAGVEPHVDFGGDPQVHSVNVIGLPAGESVEIDDELTIPAVLDPGVYYFYIVCDPHGAIDQQFRGNSQAIHLEPVTVTDEADIDLFVDEVVLPGSADDGDTIEVEATVCVTGSNPSGTTLGELYVASGTDVDFDDEPYKHFEVPSVGPGECIELTLEAEAQCRDFIDEWSAGVFVDADGSLPEENTSNNQLTSSDPLILDGPFCQCIEDDFGPNQSAQTAYPVDVAPDAPVQKEAALCEPGGCDYYMVELMEGETLLVDLAHDAERGALKSRMLNPAGSTTLDFDDSGDFQQIRRFLAPSDDDLGIGHLFRICAQDTVDGRNYYDLDISIYPQADTVDVLPHNIEIPPQDTFSVGTTFDVDLRIYNLGKQVTGPFDAQLVLTKDRDADTLGEGDDIILSTHTIDSLSAASHRDVSLETTIDSFVDDGDYYIGVDLDSGEDLNDENPENQIGFTRQFTIETECYDAFTPNDSFEEAALIDAGVTYVNLTACSASDNFYQICAPSAHSMEATIHSFDPDDGDLDLRLFDNNTNFLESSSEVGADSETVGIDYIDGDQCFYLRTTLVSLDETAENDYSLEVELEEVPEDMQCNDTFEPNDVHQDASSLWEALDYDGELDRCPKDDIDFYAVQLSPESTVDFSASLDPPLQSGTLNLQLHGPSQSLLEFDETTADNPTAAIEDFVPSTTGTHYVRISIGGDEHRVTYTLDAEGLPGVDLAVHDLNIGAGTYVQEDKIRYDFWLANFGGDDVDSVDYHVYLGESATPSPSDALLGAFEVTDIDSGDSIEIDGQTNVPSDTDPGTHYVHVVVDPDDELDDVNPANNVDSVPIEIVEDVDGDDA